MTKTERKAELVAIAEAVTKAARSVDANASAADWKQQGIHALLVVKVALDAAGVKDPKLRAAARDAVLSRGHGFGMNASQYRQFVEEPDKAANIATNLLPNI